VWAGCGAGLRCCGLRNRRARPFARRGRRLGGVETTGYLFKARTLWRCWTSSKAGGSSARSIRHQCSISLCLQSFKGTVLSRECRLRARHRGYRRVVGQVSRAGRGGILVCCGWAAAVGRGRRAWLLVSGWTRLWSAVLSATVIGTGLEAACASCTSQRSGPVMDLCWSFRGAGEKSLMSARMPVRLPASQCRPMGTLQAVSGSRCCCGC
jgi:hypothetical protein